MSSTANPSLSAEKYKYWVIDWDKREVRVATQDGRQLVEALPAAAPHDSEVAMSIFDWEKWWITNITRRQHIIFAEGYSPHTVDPTRGRPVVYLDQNHWSTVAQACLRPEDVKSSAVRAAALEVIRFASDAGIILPVSAGHLRETSALFGNKRYEVGIVMAYLSAGWQMRHPMSVWRNEVTTMLASHLGIKAPARCSGAVNTLEPNAFLADAKRPHEMDSRELFMHALSNPTVMLEVLLSPEADEAVRAHEWVEVNQRITLELDEVKGGKQQRRLIGLERFWQTELGTLSVAAKRLGLSPAEVPQFTGNQIRKLIAERPMLGRLSALFVNRYLDRNTKWKSNDLTDMIFLSCAAGYADYVAAERYTGTQLRQVETARGETGRVHLSLEGLVDALQRDGVTTASERAKESVATDAPASLADFAT